MKKEESWGDILDRMFGAVLVVSGLRYAVPETLASFGLIPPVESWYLPVGLALLMLGMLYLRGRV